MSYAVSISSKALRALENLPQGDRERTRERIDAMAENPRLPGSVKLTGHKGLHRIRSGDYRVIYTIHDEALDVRVIHIAHRRESYRDY